MTETAENRLRRLRLRSMRRGIREMDLLFSAFARDLDRLSETDLADYEALLSESDLDVLSWVTGQAPCPARYAGLVAALAATPVAPAR